MLGFKGPRKMTVIIPGMNLDHERVEAQPTNVRHIVPVEVATVTHYPLGHGCLIPTVIYAFFSIDSSLGLFHFWGRSIKFSISTLSVRSSSIFTPFSFMSFLITSLHLPASRSHYYILFSLSLHMS